MIGRCHRNNGFTLIELIIVIIIVGIMATVAVRKLGTSLETAKYEHTKKELDALAAAMVGNPSLFAEGSRTDFGYVGDVGALPPNLDALATNPGGYTTWDGPYISRGVDLNEFKQDGWGTAYLYSDTLLRSTGSGSNIDKVIAVSSSALLGNSVQGYVVDADDEMPGAIYRDSLVIRLTYPNGSGSVVTSTTSPTADGSFSFSSVPIGNQRLSVIYTPDNDTSSYTISVTPQSDVKVAVTFPADLW